MSRLATVVTVFLLAAGVARSGPPEPVPVSIESEGSVMRGRFFAAGGEGRHRTLLLMPGWPGNTEDVLGLGGRLAARGIDVLMVNPRGMHGSEGTASFAHALEDVGSAYEWLLEAGGVDASRIAVGGHSFGGGVAMAWAATDPRARRIISIAGTDHGEFIRHYQIDAFFAAAAEQALKSSAAPGGPVRFDYEAMIEELESHVALLGLRENASRLADRSILLFGGWEDRNTTVDEYMLPLYRALRGAGAADVTFRVYHDDHSFAKARDQIADDIAGWSGW